MVTRIQKRMQTMSCAPLLSASASGSPDCSEPQWFAIVCVINSLKIIGAATVPKDFKAVLLSTGLVPTEAEVNWAANKRFEISS